MDQHHDKAVWASGRVYRGDELLGTVTFRIYPRDGTAERPRSDGRLYGLDFAPVMGETLTLHLRDGRRWDFLVSNAAGRIFGSQRGLYKPQRRGSVSGKGGA